MSQQKTYKISAKYKKSTFSHDYWKNIVSGKKVVIIITTLWRWGEFNLTIDDDEKKELSNKESIIINNYENEFINNIDSCERTLKIENFDSYSEEEQEEIKNLIYKDVEDEVILEESILEEENGWELDDTIYEICGEYDLELDE